MMGSPFACPGCSHVDGNESTCDSNDVATCCGCGGIFTTRRIYLGDSYAYAGAFMAPEDVPMERRQYFDLDVLGSAGPDRRHGWIDRETRMVVQAG